MNRGVLALILVAIVYILYAPIAYTDTVEVIHTIWFRYFSILLVVFLAILFYSLLFKKVNFKFVNTVVLVFSLLQLFPLLYASIVPPSSSQIIKKYHLNKRGKVSFDAGSTPDNSPVILIVCDELGSSNEIYSVTKNEKDVSLDTFLLRKNYLLKSNFKSLSVQTKLSIPSIFNFNLHHNESVTELEKVAVEVRRDKDFAFLFSNNQLIDSLRRKKIDYYGYGLLPIKGQANDIDETLYIWEDLYFTEDIEFLKEYPIVNRLLRRSVFNYLEKLVFLRRGYYQDRFRSQILDDLENMEFKKNSFYYFHMYAPHVPFSYHDEFPIIPNGTFGDTSNAYFKNHVRYRRFILDKLMKVLRLEKFKGFRIIITGDHGLRAVHGIDGHNSLGAFYGYDAQDVEKIQTVQDIGFLINQSF